MPSTIFGIGYISGNMSDKVPNLMELTLYRMVKIWKHRYLFMYCNVFSVNHF